MNQIENIRNSLQKFLDDYFKNKGQDGLSLVAMPVLTFIPRSNEQNSDNSCNVTFTALANICGLPSISLKCSVPNTVSNLQIMGKRFSDFEILECSNSLMKFL